MHDVHSHSGEGDVLQGTGRLVGEIRDGRANVLRAL